MKFPPAPSESDLRRARMLIMRYGWNTMAYQILNPGISLWFSSLHEAVIGFVQTPTHIIVAGSPVAERTETDEVVQEFYHVVSSMNRKVCFFGAQERITATLAKYAPVSSILLGAQPVWKPEQLRDVIRMKQSLRAQVLRAKNKRVTAEVMNAKIGVPFLLPELQRVLSEWIDSRPLPPMHFLVEPDTLGNLSDRIVAAASIDGKIVGFCIATPIPQRNGWLIEQIIRGARAPNGTAELLLEKMASHLLSIGAEIVTLGLSPLSRNYTSPFAHPYWLRSLLQFTRLYGRIFYNFGGLDRFKAKFHPSDWEPVYAVTNEKAPTFSTLYAIATAFSGMPPVQFVMKGVMKSMFGGI